MKIMLGNTSIYPVPLQKQKNEVGFIVPFLQCTHVSCTEHLPFPTLMLFKIVSKESVLKNSLKLCQLLMVPA